LAKPSSQASGPIILTQAARIALAVSLLLPPAIFPQQIAVDFDPAATKINWILNGSVHTVHGTFALKQGRIAFDRATGSASG
jgi:hypothetical protein